MFVLLTQKKQITICFRRKINIKIFDFDKQNFDINKKSNQQTIKKTKIEKLKNQKLR